jgi:hypothetical protein
MALSDDVETGEAIVIGIVVIIVGYLLYKIYGFIKNDIVEPVTETAKATREAVQKTGAGQKDPSQTITGTEWQDWWNSVSGWFKPTPQVSQTQTSDCCLSL